MTTTSQLQLKLCYAVRGHVANALSFMEVHDEHKAERAEMATKNLQMAATEVEELFKVLTEGLPKSALLEALGSEQRAT